MPKEKTQTKPKDYQIVVRLPEDLGRQLREQAAREDRPIARVVRSAILMYVQQSSLIGRAK